MTPALSQPKLQYPHNLSINYSSTGAVFETINNCYFNTTYRHSNHHSMEKVTSKSVSDAVNKLGLSSAKLRANFSGLDKILIYLD